MIRDFLNNIHSISDNNSIPTLTHKGIEYIPKKAVEALIDKIKMLDLEAMAAGGSRRKAVGVIPRD